MCFHFNLRMNMRAQFVRLINLILEEMSFFKYFGCKHTLGNIGVMILILMGGHAKCLLLMTRGEGGGQKSQKPAYVIHGCSLSNYTKVSG